MAGTASAWDNLLTHPELVRSPARRLASSGTSLDVYLREELGLERGIAEKLAVQHGFGPDEEGWSLVELTGVLPAEPRSFEAVRSEVEASLREKQAATEFRELLDELRAKADVRIDEDALEKLASPGPGAPPSSRPSVAGRFAAPRPEEAQADE